MKGMHDQALNAIIHLGVLTSTLPRRILRRKDGIYAQSEYGTAIFREKIIRDHGNVYREWEPKRSKLGAAILNGLDQVPVGEESRILYLGASTGTTVSYISDLAFKGMVFAVELSYDPFLKLLKLSESRNNIIPILEDAGNPEKFSFLVDRVDLIYQDISQRDQIGIFNENASMFKEAEWAILILKARSISARKSEKEILSENIARIKDFRVLQKIDLKPYDLSNYLLLMKRK